MRLLIGLATLTFAGTTLGLSVLGQDAPALGNENSKGKSSVTKASVPVVESINETMQKFVDRGVVSGAVTLVAKDGRISHLGSVGLADLDKQKPMRTNAIFSIASMTKPITATAVMMLVEEGKLDLDDKVSQYIPEFANVRLANGEPPAREITIRDALTHTSGLKGDQVFRGSLADAVDEIATRPLAFQPGTEWKYSPGLNVCGRIVEIVAEQPFESFVKERIFDPLKMRNTTFHVNEAQRKRMPALYGLGEDKKSLAEADNRISGFSKDDGPNPSGGLASTARDMFQFYAMVLGNGRHRGQRVLASLSVADMTRCQTGDLKTGFTPGNGWGLGWCVVQEPQGVTAMLSKGTFGHGGAFGTQGWVDPKTKTIYVLMIQRTQMGNSDGSEIRKAFQQAAVNTLGSGDADSGNQN